MSKATVSGHIAASDVSLPDSLYVYFDGCDEQLQRLLGAMHRLEAVIGARQHSAPSSWLSTVVATRSASSEAIRSAAARA